MKRKWTWTTRAVLLAVVMCVLLCLGMGAVKAPDGASPRELPPSARRMFGTLTDQQRAALQPYRFVGFSMSDKSLEVREHTDFLLTPALLVQEAVSDGVVLTYPEE